MLTVDFARLYISPGDAYHRMLVWDIKRRPAVTWLAGGALNPLIGKSIVVCATKSRLTPPVAAPYQ